MIKNENRRFPRITHVTSRQIVRIDDGQTPKKNIVLTGNLSACGIKFTTNEDLKTNSYFLIYLNDLLVKDLNQNSKNLLKTGDFYLSKVIWSNPAKAKLFDVGAAFLEKKASDARDMDTLTELVNISMLDLLPEVTKQL